MPQLIKRDPLSGRRGLRLAFAPWVAYWVLSALGNWPAAQLSGFALAAALNAYRIVRRSPKLMDAVAAAFFTAAIVSSSVLQSPVFVRWGPVLAYGTLALMACGSLVARAPFTAQYVRDDWPRELWANPIFLATNALISAIWGGIFLLAGLIHLPLIGLSEDAVIWVPWGLVMFGVTSSRLLSRWYPRWRLARQNSAGP